MLPLSPLRAAAVSLVALCATPMAQAATLDGSAPLVIAHRGASGYLPEHTLAAYELAVKMGADYIEPDLQLTADKQLVAMHDDTLGRTTNVAALFAPRNGGYNVADFTLAEIKTLTVTPTGTASNSYPGFTPTSADPLRVPTFQEVIDLAKQQSASAGRTIGIYPEAKQADPVMEDAILATLVANGYGKGTDKVFIQSFSYDTIKSLDAKQKALGLDMNLILLGVAVEVGGDELMGLVSGSAVGFDEVNDYADGLGILVNYSLYPLDEAFIDAAHAAGLAVHGWTFADPNAATAIPDYLKYFDWGMDGVFSNYPDLADAARDTFVPEPGMLGLFALGLAGLAWRSRRDIAA